MSNERFILESRLDQGRFGTVYRAIDTRESFDGRGRTVALWLLPPEFTANKPALELFRRDYLRIRELAHPAIARVYELGRDGDRVFVTSELLDGETLRKVLDHLRPEKLDTEEADEVIGVVGDALAYAHELGIVHADVRSENVLVTTDHEIKLLNLMSTSLMRSNAVTGGPSGDVRDLAALAYELYTGEPFGQHAEGKRLKGVAKRRARAIERALADRSARPYASAREFLLDAGLARAPIPYYAAARPAAAAPPRERSAARQLMIPVAGAAALALGIYSGGNIDALLEAVPIDRWLGAVRNAPDGPHASPAAAPVESRLDAREFALREPARFDSGVSPGRPSDGARHAKSRDAPAAPNGDSADTRGSSTPGSEVPQSDAPDSAPPDSDATSASSRGSDPLTAEAPTDTARDEALARSPRAAAASASFSLGTAAVTAYESQTSVTVEIVRSGSASEPAQVIWWTEEGTAVAGDDYASFGRRVESFAPGETVRTVQIPITSDVLPESDEHFFVHLDERSTLGPTSVPTTTRVTLIDDD